MLVVHLKKQEFPFYVDKEWWEHTEEFRNNSVATLKATGMSYDIVFPNGTLCTGVRNGNLPVVGDIFEIRAGKHSGAYIVMKMFSTLYMCVNTQTQEEHYFHPRHFTEWNPTWKLVDNKYHHSLN